eukprot:gi/632938419/ref/XP_007904877.1/ PREDICTED: protein unc-13 homolog A-like isoform X2 [Callorhinchus milii]
MSLLCAKVKRGKLNGPLDKFNTYVTLKVQNLKSTTVTRRGNEPQWEQDYMFEISDLDKGLVVEVWDKGLIWDSLLGTAWIPLRTITYATEEGPGDWWILNSEVLVKNDEICGAENPTLHEILLDIYFELPAEIPEDEARYLIERLKNINIQIEQEKNVKDICSKHDPVQNQNLSLVVSQNSPTDSASEEIDSDYRSDPNNASIKRGNGHLKSGSGAAGLSPQIKCKLSPQKALSASVESRPCSSTTLSRANSQLTYSEESESEAVHSYTVDSECESRSTWYSSHQDSQEQSTCCSQSSSCSCSSQDELKMDLEPNEASRKTSGRKEMMDEDIICTSTIERSRWRRAIKKEFSWNTRRNSSFPSQRYIGMEA